MSNVLIATHDSTASQKAYELTIKVFSEPDAHPDGLLITNDLVTYGVMQALDEMKIDVGRDVHLVSSANRGSTVLQAYQDQLVLMEFAPDQIAGKIMELMEEQINCVEAVGENRVVRPILHIPNPEKIV